MPERAERSAPNEERESKIAVPEAAPADALSPAPGPFGLQRAAGSQADSQLVAHRLLGLQRTAGNRAVSQLVARRPEEVEAPPAASTKELIAKAYESKDPGDVKAIGNKNFGEATEAQRWDFIHTLAFQGWVGPRDEWALEALWKLWGDKVLTRAAEHPDYWAKSIEGGAELLDLPSVKATPPKFIEDVRAVATGYLDKNEEYAKREQADLGEQVEGVAGPPRDPKARMAEIEEGAKLVRSAQKAQAALGDYAVGWLEAHDEDSSPDMPEEHQKTAPPAGFVHGSPPFYAHKAPKLTYAEVEAQWQVLQKVIEGQHAKFPALYAVAHHGESGDMQKIADGGTGGRALILNSLRDLRTRITETRPKLAGGLAFEIAPIHGQLFGGKTKGPSQIDWHDPVYKPLGQEILEGHKEHDFWVTLGLGSLAAGMFLIATLGAGAPLVAAAAAGGAAGVSAGVAAASWEKAYTVAQAEKTSASKETELVASGAATAAVVEAVINSVFAVIDGWAAFKLAGKAAETAGGALVTSAAKAGEARAIVFGVERVSTMAQREAVDTIERNVIQNGIEDTIKRSGLSAEKLLEKVGDVSRVSARLRQFMALPEELQKISAEELGRRLGDLKGELARNREVGQDLVRAGVEKLGPMETLRKSGGWLGMRLKGDSTLMQPFVAWRDAALADLDRFLEQIAVPQGEKAVGERNKLAEEFLAARLGGTTEELGIGTSKAIIPGTGEKEMSAALAAAADRRATSHLGLANPDAMREMARSGASLKERWASLAGPKARLDALVDLANERLRAARVPEFRVRGFIKDGKGQGKFGRADWSLELDMNMLMRETMPDEMIELVYHETRHAEQAFQVGRLRSSTMSVEQMAKPVAEGGLGMSRETAEIAARSPLSAESAEGRLAEQWAESLTGKAGAPARAKIYADMDAARDVWRLALEEKAGKSGAELAAHEKRIDQLWENYMAELNKYKQLPEEADAYAIQAKFREAESQHYAELRERQPATVRPAP